MGKLKVKTRSLSLFLALAMIFTMLPIISAPKAEAATVPDSRVKAAAEIMKGWLSSNYIFKDSDKVETRDSVNSYYFPIKKALHMAGFDMSGVFNTTSLCTKLGNLGFQRVGVTSYSSALDCDIVCYSYNENGYFMGMKINDVSKSQIVYNSNSAGKLNKTGSYAPSIRFAYRLLVDVEEEPVDPDDDPNKRNIGDDFYAYIMCRGQGSSTIDRYGRVLTLDDTNSASTVNRSILSFKNPDLSNQKQIWHFKRDSSNGCYTIVNYVSNNQNGRFYLKAEGNTSDWTSTNASVKPSVVGNADGHTGSLEPFSSVINEQWRVVFAGMPTNSDAKLQQYALRPNYDGAHLMNNQLGTGQAILYRDEGYASNFYIVKINEIADGVSARINYDSQKTTFTNDGANKSLALNEGTDKTTVPVKAVEKVSGSWTSDAFSKQVWIFELVKDSNGVPLYPPRYRIRNEYSGDYIYNTNTTSTYNYKIGLTKDQSVYNTTKAEWLLLGNGNDVKKSPICENGLEKIFIVSLHMNDGSKEYAFLDKNEFDGNNKYSTDDKKKYIQAFNVTDNNELIAYPNHFQVKEIFSIQAVRQKPDQNKTQYIASIKSDIDTSYAVSLARNGESLSTDTNETGVGVVLRKIASTPAMDQLWVFKLEDRGTDESGNKKINYRFTIQNIGNSMYLTTDGDGKSNGQKIQVMPIGSFDNNAPRQWFIVLDLSGGYSIRSQPSSSYALDVPSKTTGNEIELAINSFKENTGYKNQEFTIVKSAQQDISYYNVQTLGDGGTYWAYIKPAGDTNKNKYLRSTESTGTQLSFKTITDETEKRKQENYWKFERIKDGSYKITSCSVEDGTINRSGQWYDDVKTTQNILLYQDTAYYNDRWYICQYEVNGVTYYTFKTKGDSQEFVLSGNSLVSGIEDSKAESHRFDIVETDLFIQNTDDANIKVDLFNYGSQINSVSNKVLNFYNASSHGITADGEGVDVGYGAQPTMKSKLDDDGYPEVASYTSGALSDAFYNTSGSLKYLFDVNASNTAASGVDYSTKHYTVTKPSGLFQKSEQNGFYYYDSLLNAASFKETTNGSYEGTFSLYDYTIRTNEYNYSLPSTSVSTTTGLNKNTGNFLPFDLGHVKGNVSYKAQNGTSKRGKITSTNPYVTTGDDAPVNYQLNSDAERDLWFGMSLEFDFEQAKNGMYEGNPAQFNFEGDDDVWVYIDGVLVLDLGGCDTSQAGSIDFSTGTVKDINGTSTLRAKYQTAISEAGGSFTYNRKTIDNNYVNSNFKGNTFKSGTRHKIKVFYLERGGDTSYCKLNFNLPKGSPMVTKTVSNVEKVSGAADKYYKFRIVGFEDKNDGNKLATSVNNIKTDSSNNYVMKDIKPVLSDVFYTVTDIYGAVVKNGDSEEFNLANDGTFYLKHGQTATFHGIDDDVCYKVIEYRGVYNGDANKTEYTGTKVIDTTAKFVQTSPVVGSDSFVEIEREYDYSFDNYNDNKTPLQISSDLPQHIYFTNTLSTDNQVKITYKYYDRTVSNSVANINTKQTQFSKVQEWYGETLTKNKVENLIVYTIAEADTAGTDKGKNTNLNNLIDDYVVFASQTDAISYMTGKKYLDNNGDVKTINDAESEYHTDSQRKPITPEENGEKWVTFRDSNGSSIEVTGDNYNAVKEIVVWLYNKPKTYTVTTHVPNDTSPNGKAIKFEGYYNQQLGNYYNASNGVTAEVQAYCNTYSIPYEEYDARGVDTSAGEAAVKTYTYSGAAATFDGQSFSYWKDENVENANIISSDINYNFRITQNMDLFAVYGSTDMGVTTTQSDTDVFYDTNGTKKLRLNIVMNPYGIDNGQAGVGNPKITQVSSAFVSLNSIGKERLSRSDASTVNESIRKQIRIAIYNNQILDPNERQEKFNVNITGSYNDLENVVLGVATISVYPIVNGVGLTNKNRVQFVNTITASSLQENNIIAYTSMYYDHEWYVSSNYANYS